MQRQTGAQYLQKKLDFGRVRASSKPVSLKPYVRKKFEMKLMRDHIRFTEHSSQSISMISVLEDMMQSTDRHNVSMPVSTCIIKHSPGGRFEFALETQDSIKHYIFEDI